MIVNPRQGASCTYIDAVFDREDLEDGEAILLVWMEPLSVAHLVVGVSKRGVLI